MLNNASPFFVSHAWGALYWRHTVAENTDMERTLEPELMEDEQQALAYARADFSTSNQWYVDHLLQDCSGALRTVLDIGCGPGDVMVRLAAAHAGTRITAIDGSGAMLSLARAAVSDAGLNDRITLLQGHIPGLPLP